MRRILTRLSTLPLTVPFAARAATVFTITSAPEVDTLNSTNATPNVNPYSSGLRARLQHCRAALEK